MCYQCDDPVPGEIPGDPDTVRRFAHAFQDTAQALRDAARELRNVANENITISLAIDEVRSKADEVTGDTGRVAERYQGAADTFGNYAEALDDARRTGNGARSQIIANNDAGRYWRHRERDLRLLVQMGSTDPEVLQDLQEATRRANYHDTQYGTYIGRYSGAESARDDAVRAAIQGLQDAADAAGLDDGWFDGILGDLQQLWELVSKYLGPVLEVLREVLEILKQIVDVLALICTILAIFIPAFGPLAAGLSALSFLMSVAIFALSLVLFLMGRETIGRVLSDGLSVVTSVLLSKVGGSGGGSILGDSFSKIGSMGSGFAQFGLQSRSVLLNLGSQGLANFSQTAGQYLADKGTSMLASGTMSAMTAPIKFALNNEADFMLGSTSPWAPETSPDLTSLFVGMGNLPTLGLAGKVDTAVDLFQASNYEGLTSSWNETFETWGSIGAVPAT